MSKKLETGSVWVTLFSSGSTLICCALPAILVAVGAGSTVAALVGFFPQLVWISEHKVWLFGFGAIMLVSSRYFTVTRPVACPTDPRLADSCRTTKQWSGIVWWVSVMCYAIGFGVSYVAPLFLK